MTAIPWEQIATQDWYRTADARKRALLRKAWLDQVAPQMYPEVMLDRRVRNRLSQSMLQYEMGPPLQDEFDILTPDTINMHSIRKVETNPLFAGKRQPEQQYLKDVWYKKVSANDPEFRSLPIEEQQEFYKKLMTRAPAYESGSTFLFGEYETEDQITEAHHWEESRKAVEAIAGNLTDSLVRGFGALVTGPIMLLTGKDSQFSRVMRDLSKQKEWLNTVASEHNRFFTQIAPTFIGYGAGLMAGPFHGLENLLAGRVVTGGKGMITLSQGALSAAGAKIGLRAPELAYQVAGGGIAGMLQGLAEVPQTGEKWESAVARDATLGVAFEFLSRYLGMVRAVKQAAKAAGVKTGRLYKAPLQLGTPAGIDPDLEALYRANPIAAAMQGQLYSVDPKGIMYKVRDSEQGVRLYSKMLGYDEPEIADNLIRLKRKGQTVQEFRSAIKEDRIRHVINFLEDDDSGWEVWEKTLAGKKVAEAIETMPHIEMRLGVMVPEAARKHIVKRLSDFGVPGIDMYKDPKANSEAVDRVYTILRGSKSGKKAAESLSALGIQLDIDTKSHRQAVLQLQKELKVINPEGSYTLINERTGNILSMQDNPAVYLEHPELKNLYVPGMVAEGDAQTIRDAITGMRKSYRNEKSALTRLFRSRVGDLYRFEDSEIVELRVKLPFDGGLQDVNLHFQSLKHAQDFLTLGQNMGLDGAANKFFKDNDLLQKSFDDFAKSMRKYNQAEYYKSFMPQKYAAALAEQEGFYLGSFRGKYIIQDIHSGNDIDVRTFDNLRDVFGFLKHNDGRLALPDFADPLSAKAFEEAYPRGLTDLMQDIPRMEVERIRKFSIRDTIPRAVAPPQHMFERFERLAGLDDLRARGLGPVSMYNKIRDMSRAQQSFLHRNLDQLKQAKGGKNFGKKAGTYVSRYLEALDDEVELKNAPIRNLDYELKGDVYNEMVRAFGTTQADALVARSSSTRRFLNDMFSLSGMDGDKYVKHYLPHMREVSERFGNSMSTRIDPRKVTQIPDADKQFFFEIMREADPKHFWWTRDIDEVLDNYVHLMSRAVTIRPTMKELGKVIRETTAMYASRGAVPEDYRNYVNYVASIFESIEGVKGVGDEVFRYATENTLGTIADAINAKFKTSLKFAGKADAINTLVTMATGAHIGARPYTWFRNLTQSLLTGGSTIGARWWAEGMDTAIQPGRLEYLKRIGMIVDQVMPAGAGPTITKGLIQTPVFVAMQPYKWADSVNRAVVYYGMQARIDNAFQLYRQGKISAKQFVRKSGANLFGKAQYNEAVSMLNTRRLEDGFEAFKDRLSRIAVDRTQYLYNAFDQPQMFRRGVGRLFGQYTSWPINYWNLLKDRMMSDSLTAAQKVGFLARWGTITAAIATGLHSAGVSPRSYAPWNATTFEGGPYFQLLNDALAAASGDISAYTAVVDTLTSLMPFAYEGQGIYRAIEAYRDGDPYEAFLHLASAPTRISLYPRRETHSDKIKEVLTKAGQRMFGHFKDVDIIQESKDRLGVDFGL